MQKKYDILEFWNEVGPPIKHFHGSEWIMYFTW